MTALQEIELKFLVPDNKLTAIKRQTHIKSAINTHLSAHYFDTDKQDLAKAGIAIRIRQESNSEKDDWIQTLKTSGDGLAARLEHNHQLDSDQALADHADETLYPELSVYNDTAIAKTLNKTLAKAIKKSAKNQSVSPLTLLYSTDVHRTTRLLIGQNIEHQTTNQNSNQNIGQKNADKQLIEVAFDTGTVSSTDSISGEKLTQTLQEVEFELLQGDTDFLFKMAKIWCKRYHLCLSTVTKAERGSLVMKNQTHPKAVKSDLSSLTNSLNKNSTQPEFMRTIVHNCLLQIMPNASAIVSGSVGQSQYASEHIHQLRVGIRRLRTALKLFSSFSSAINPQWQRTLQKTFAQLGEYRDYEILLTKTQPRLVTLGAPDIDWQPLEQVVSVMPMDAVSSNDFQLALLELIEFTLSDATLEEKQLPAKPAVKKILDKLFNKIAKASDNFAHLNIEAQHDIRKRLKALRYLSEFSASLFASNPSAKKNKSAKKAVVNPQKTAKDLMKYLEPAQEVLGEYNDNIVAHEFYVQKAIMEPKAYFAVGWFLAREKQSAELCAKSLKSVRNAPKFWTDK